MINKDIKLLSQDQKLQLALHLEGPKTPKAVILFSHGMAEHKERYYDFIHFLNNHDYLCAIHDHRGHGESVENVDDYGYFYDDSGQLIVEDMQVITQYLKQLYPTIDIFMFSHSMGTLVARNYLQKNDNQIKKIVFSGPPYNNKSANAGYLIAKFTSKLHGKKYRSNLIQKIAFGAFDKKFGGIVKNEWLCSDHQQVELYNKNSKCGFVFTANGFQCLFYLVKNCFRKDAYQVNNKQLKMFFIAGSDDPVISNEKKFLAEIQFMNKLGYQQTSYKLYSGMRHELLNERNKEIVYQDILDFYEQ